MNIQDFYRWEMASRDTVDVKTIYIDLMGDLAAGVFLSQLIYWFLPDKKGQTKLRVKRDGKYWLVKSRSDWWGECRVSVRQVDRAIKTLKEMGIIETMVGKFNSNPTTHIWLPLSQLFPFLLGF